MWFTGLVMKNTTDYPLPIVHLNGTSREMLAEGWDKSSEALDLLVEAFRATTFHSRDYYPLGDDAWTEALNKRIEMRVLLDTLREYIDAHRAHLQD